MVWIKSKPRDPLLLLIVSARTHSAAFAQTCWAIEAGSLSLFGVIQEPLSPNCIPSITVSASGHAVEYQPNPDLKLSGTLSIQELT